MTTIAHDCECSSDHPGILWPWGSDGEYPPALPYVERCDTCQRYCSDHDAADALVAQLLAVGLDPLVGEHVRHATDPESHARVQRRARVYVFPSPTAVHPDARGWEMSVTAAKSSLALAPTAAVLDRPRPHAEVHVVRPPDPAEDVAVFEREQDAHAFWQTYVDSGSSIGDVEHAIVCDAELAARMIAERQRDQLALVDARERATCAGCLARTYRGEACVCPEPTR